MKEITIVKMEGRSLFTTTSNTFIWNSYTFTVLFIASCGRQRCFILLIVWIVFLPLKRAIDGSFLVCNTLINKIY